jgi:pyruvate ferredoxin oxidoreductase beta subunit
MPILGLPEEEYMLPGYGSCPGCGLFLTTRHVLKALGRRTLMVIPAGCISAAPGLFPKIGFGVPTLNIAFEATASAASGIAAALKVKGIKDITVLGVAGDGGTADIGIQALSAAAERNDNFIYVCIDNEAYMNTGIQRSGTTPFRARTTTTPVIGKLQHKKDMPIIMAAHEIPYVATACVAYPHDLHRKIRKALEIGFGTRYIHILSPCPPGWGFDAERTIEMGRLAVETGLFALFEIENFKLKFTGPSINLVDPSKRRDVKEYLRLQRRFAHLKDGDIEEIRKWIDNKWRQYIKLSMD